MKDDKKNVFASARKCCWCSVRFVFILKHFVLLYCYSRYTIASEPTLLTVRCGLNGDSHDIVAERLNSLHFIMSQLNFKSWIFFSRCYAWYRFQWNLCFCTAAAAPTTADAVDAAAADALCVLFGLARVLCQSMQLTNRMQMAIIDRLLLDRLIFIAWIDYFVSILLLLLLWFVMNGTSSSQTHAKYSLCLVFTSCRISCVFFAIRLMANAKVSIEQMRDSTPIAST